MNTKIVRILLAVITSACAHGQGTLVFDQQSASIEYTNLSLANIQPSEPIGQSFVPTLSSVGFVRLYVSDSSFIGGASATITVNLRSDSITGPVLGSASLDLHGAYFGYTNFVFSTAAMVTPGTLYFFQLDASSADTWLVSEGYQYPNGAGYYFGVAHPLDSLWFREGIIVPEPSSAILLCACFATGALRFRKRSPHSAHKSDSAGPCGCT